MIDWRPVLEWARGMAGWQVAAAIVLVQVVLFAFAQPGSVMFWVAALLYSPPVATLILTTGGTAGGVAGYWLAHRMIGLDQASRDRHRLFGLIERHGDFFTLCALRVLPGVPHSVINYASGALHLPIGRFVAATTLGLAAKSFLYASAVHNVAEDASLTALLKFDVLAPLIGIGLILLLGRVIWQRRSQGRTDEDRT
jgi:uncharacterized membrane protein YdjX (TVP38/TMEM64 family)